MGLVTIYFQDNGQDFLEFDISCGIIAESRPLGGKSWRHFKVVTEESAIKPGTLLQVKDAKLDEAPVMTIKHPILRVDRHPIL